MRNLCCLLLVLTVLYPVSALAVTQTVSLSSGFNFVAPTVIPDSNLDTSAEILAAATAVEQVFRFDATTQQFSFQLRLSGDNIFGAPFTLVAGQGLVLKCSAPATVQLTGSDYTGVTTELLAGFNFVGFPILSVNPTASSLLTTHTGLSSIFKWNTSNESFDFFMKLSNDSTFGTDFALEPGYGYFLNASTSHIVTFGELLPTGVVALDPVDQSPGTGQIEGWISGDVSNAAPGINRAASIASVSNIKVWLKNNPEVFAFTDDKGHFLLKKVPETLEGYKHNLEFEKLEGEEKFRGIIPDVECFANHKVDLNTYLQQAMIIKLSGTIQGVLALADGASPFGSDVYIPGISGMVAKTDDDGSFSMLYIPEGTFTLVLQAYGYQTYKSEVSVVAGDVVQLGRVVLDKVTVSDGLATIEGNLTRTDGQPLFGVVVSLISDDGTADTAAVSNAVGHFNFKGLVAGSYKLVFTKEGFAAVHDEVSVTAGQTLQTDQQLVAVTGAGSSYFAITGTVTDFTGSNPMVGCQMTTVPPTDQYYTDAEGRYAFLVPAGRYTVVASRWGYLPASQIVDVQKDETVVFQMTKDDSIAPVLRGITLATQSVQISVGGTLDLSTVAVIANWSDGTTTEVTNLVQWSKLSGGGSISGGVYTGADTVGEASLSAGYTANSASQIAILNISTGLSGMTVSVTGSDRVAVGKSVVMIATSNSSNGGIAFFNWSATGGQFNSTTGSSVIWTAPMQTGEVSILVSGQDGFGATGNKVKSVEVFNTAPSAEFVYTKVNSVSRDFQFDASPSFDDEHAADQLTVSWDWDAEGPNEATPFVTEKNAIHRFNQSGLHVVSLDVADSLGMTTRVTHEIIVVPDTKTITIGDNFSMEFVWIPAGSFYMGSPDTELNRQSDEGPLHNVTISKGFWMGKVEVTQNQWKEIMGSVTATVVYGLGDDNAVYQVSWDDSQMFLESLNNNLPLEGTFRLPTEAEWEYACRAGSTTSYYWGSAFSGEYCWYRDNANFEGTTQGGAHPVGQKLPNAWGLHDMIGNCIEWCSDWYGSEYYLNSNDVDPQGPDTGTYRVKRGGNWATRLEMVRSADRGFNFQHDRDNSSGFRVVLSIY